MRIFLNLNSNLLQKECNKTAKCDFIKKSTGQPTTSTTLAELGRIVIWVNDTQLTTLPSKIPLIIYVFID